jgi:AAA+ ATPase superfamily predicted ATPase
MIKPDDIFDRGHEWTALEGFVTSPRAGAALGLVYGRRRQGKTYLLQGLVDAAGGFYFAALRQSSEQNMQRLADSYRDFVGSRARIAFASWEEALTSLLALGQAADGAVPVVLDEFPYLLAGAPELPSLLQDLLSPRGVASRNWPTRLILCGSALSTMRGLLAGTAPLRGRAALELVVHSFGYRDAAAYWRVGDDPDLAVRLHALVGGTPAYLDMCGGVGPGSAEDLDTWVVRVLLNPASAMFREGNVLLAEEDRIVDTSAYLSVLTAISQGRTRRGEIAVTTGRPQTALGHPLAVLTEARLVAPLADALRQKRTTFHISEPVLRLHQLVIAPNEARLSRHRGEAVWAAVADTVSAKIYGPHLEMIARTWCIEHASLQSLGGAPTRVAPAEVTCREHRCNHEVDVVVIETRPQETDRVCAIGEAKWRSRPSEIDQLRRLEHLRQLFALPPETKLLLFSRKGFMADLTAEAAGRRDVELVDLERLYLGD